MNSKILVSPEDEDLLLKKWRIYGRPATCPYARRDSAKKDGRRFTERMHRVIMERMIGRELRKDEFIDHIDFNGLNNKRENLRIVSASENNARTRIKKRNPNHPGYSKYRGVVRISPVRFRAQISVNNKIIIVGDFKTDREAALAYDDAARKYRGKYCITNF